jgi:hypothetical protein
MVRPWRLYNIERDKLIMVARRLPRRPTHLSLAPQRFISIDVDR